VIAAAEEERFTHIKHGNRPIPCHTVNYIPVTGSHSTHSPAAARNIGWRAVQGEIIAFTDDDCILSPGWLKAGVGALTDDIVGVARCLIRNTSAAHSGSYCFVVQSLCCKSCTRLGQVS
jgi:hypothetical protein